MDGSNQGRPVEPEWTPPDHLYDPLVARVDVPRYVWLEAIKRRLPGLAEYAIGRGLAEHGNKDGTRCYPGIALLAEENSTTEKTVKKTMAWLIEHGWVRLAERGVRKLGKSNVYHLTMPAPLAAQWARKVKVGDDELWMPWWTSKDGSQWEERRIDDDARHASRAPVDPVEVPPRYRFRGVSRAPLESSRAPRDPFLEGREVPPPVVDPPLNHHSDPLDRPHADARGSQRYPSFDEDDLYERAESLTEFLQDDVGDIGTEPMVDSMIQRYHPNAIINTARKGRHIP